MMTLTYCSTVLVLHYAAPVAKVLSYTDKKENKIFLIYKEIEMGSGAKSYIRKCENFSSCGRMPLVIYDFVPDPS
jgi:hypothetical protein